MTGLPDVIHVNVGILHLKHRSRVCQNVTVLRLWQDYCEPSRGLARSTLHAADVNADGGQPLRGYFPERIPANFRYKTDSGAEDTQIVCEDRRRTAQRECQTAGQVLSVQHQVLGQPVQDEIQVEFAHDADFDHSSSPFTRSDEVTNLRSGMNANVLNDAAYGAVWTWTVGPQVPQQGE